MMGDGVIDIKRLRSAVVSVLTIFLVVVGTARRVPPCELRQIGTTISSNSRRNRRRSRCCLHRGLVHSQ